MGAATAEKAHGRRWRLAVLPLLLWLLCLSSAFALTADDQAGVGGELMQADKALGQMAERMGPMRESLGRIAHALPTLGTEIGAAMTRIGSGEPGLFGLLLLFVLCIGISGAVALWVRRITRHWHTRVVDSDMQARNALGVVLLDALHWGVFAVSAYACVKWLTGGNADSPGSLFLVSLVSAVVRWTAVLLFLALTLRPRYPALRLVNMPDKTAHAVAFWCAAGSLVGAFMSTLIPTWLKQGMPLPTGQALGLIEGVVLTLCYARAASHYKRAFVMPTRSQRIWFWLAAVSIPLGFVVWTLSVIHLRFALLDSLLYTLRIGLALYVIQALLALSARSHWWVRLMQHATVAGALLGLSILLTDLWAVRQLRLLSEATWEPIRQSLVTTAITLFVGFVAWRYLDLWTEQRLRRASHGLAPSMDEDVPAEPASRLTTVLPLVRISSGVAILTLVAFLGMQQLGVNVTTLLAGAGVFGLALSFGSQALVRDIVSGIFFMSDDAFRVGEYIDTGKLKGTVERVTMRSVRLRHQNGQIHTIPFGQLQAITNYSRDWLTVKFNLRLALDTDVEKTRKCAKRLGQELLEDPEFGPEFLMPLKQQGVTDIVDNALVLRFKFTARPGNPSMLQREILKRLHRAFTAEGIAFANGMVTVQQVGEVPALLAASGAASAVIAAAKATEAAAGNPAT